MLPLVLPPSLDRTELLLLDLPRLHHLLRHAAMARNAADLRHVLVPCLQRLVVLEFLSLAGTLDAASLVGLRAPEANVAVVAAAEDVLRVRGECGGEDALHAFGVVDVAAVAAGAAPETDGAVVGGGDEFLAGGGEGDVHDGGDVVFEDVEGTGHLTGVEDVDVVVFVGDSEVEGFHGVPGDGVGGEGEDGFGEGGLGAQVVEDEGAVGGGGGEEGGFGLVEGDGGNGVGGGGPVEGLQGRGGGAGQVVDGDDAGGGGEVREGAVVREGSVGCGAEVGC